MDRLIVMGTGPIGGIIGGRLARAGQDVTFVDVDKEHITAIREKGLQVDVPDGPFNVKIPIVLPGNIQGRFDTAFIAVRSNYTSDTLKAVLPHLRDDGLLVSLQNGINPPLLEKKIGPDRTVGVAIRMGSRRIAPGHLYTDTRGHLYVGHLHGKTTPQLRKLNELLESVIPSEISDNLLGVLWSKLTYTCLGYFGSLADAALATSCADEKQRRLLVEFLGEVVAVGNAMEARFIALADYNRMRGEYIGICLACEAERESTEPDACDYPCEECGEPRVFGIEELLLMGEIDITPNRLAPFKQGGTP